MVLVGVRMWTPIVSAFSIVVSVHRTCIMSAFDHLSLWV
jgi:hypothetical protein